MDGKLDINTKEGYDIATALRGPDNEEEDHHLKIITTGVVRSLAGLEVDTERWEDNVNVNVSTGGAFMATPEQARAYWKELTKEGQAAVVKTARKNSHHGSHARNALDVLGAKGKNHAAWLVEIGVLGGK